MKLCIPAVMVARQPELGSSKARPRSGAGFVLGASSPDQLVDSLKSEAEDRIGRAIHLRVRTILETERKR